MVSPVDWLAVARMTLPQAQAFFLVAMDEARSVSKHAEHAVAPNFKHRRLPLTPGLGLVECRRPECIPVLEGDDLKALVLDLIQPHGAGGRLGRFGQQAGRDEAGATASLYKVGNLNVTRL